MRASVMLDRSNEFEILKIERPNDGKRTSVLLLHKVTETGSPFIVVAGYYLSEVEDFEESILAEIETIPESEYSTLKDVIRHRGDEKSKKVPITFW